MYHSLVSVARAKNIKQKKSFPEPTERLLNSRSAPSKMGRCPEEQ
jgi:hypothetical protein